MRIAWLGPAKAGGGVGEMGALLLEGLLAAGVEVDYYTFDPPENMPPGIIGHPGLTVEREPSRWKWNRWYSRTPILTFLSGLVARTRAHGRLCTRLIANHPQRQYDIVLQFSQTELFKLGRHLDQLPPVIVYPCVHAAGELRWHRRESADALQSEHWYTHYPARLLLWYRAAVQRRSLHKPVFVLGMSKRFNELVAADYQVDPSRQGVLYHAIRSVGQPLLPLRPLAGRKLRIIFVARISVRKGVEQMVELSKRLDDLRDSVEIELIGDRTQWSDYRGHMKELNPNTARYRGGLGHADTMKAYEEADILVLPSRYEPGGIVVGEALSRGVCVVASDEVGSSEPIDAACCRRFPAGDIDAFERATRQMIDDLRRDQPRLRDLAAAEAQRCFNTAKIAGELIHFMQQLAPENAASASAR